MKGFVTTAVALAWLASGLVAGAPPSLKKATQISNHYIVQYHDGITDDDREKHEKLFHSAVQRHNKYRGIMNTFNIGSFKGYHVEMDSAAVKELMAANIIKDVLPDARINVSSPVSLDPPLQRRDTISPVPNTDIRIIPSATWGQSRLSHRERSATDFVYERGGSTAYVVDTGIRLTHEEFLTANGTTSRAIWGANFIPDSPDTDENGHGTHVAGTIGGRTLGIAPSTELVAVKVFDKNGGGPWSGVLAAMDWIVSDAKAKNRVGRSVINMSLGGGKFQPIDDAVTAAVNAGITVVVAAGNTGEQVSGISPAGNPDAITVGGIYDDDSRAEWSNYGAGLDVWAPGWDIKSAWIDSDTATRNEAGTSMACPHVAGLAAYFIQQYGPHTPQEMRKRIDDMATKGKVQNIDAGSANAIAYNGNTMFM